MSIETIAKFFDTQLDNIGKVKEAGNFPWMDESLTGEIDGEKFILNITIKKEPVVVKAEEKKPNFTTPVHTTNEKDAGWDSIAAMLDEPEFKRMPEI